ncbi:MAG TPA: ZIP family metal transporter [Candidatus Kapabacteria bacterium]|jgi:zinc transporter ZupT
MLLGIVLSIVASLAQVSGGLLVQRKKVWPQAFEGTLLALGAGFLLALAFLELIPGSLELTNRNDFALLAMLIGFSALHFFEHILAGHMHFGEETHEESALGTHSLFGAIGGLAVHAFFDGMSICAAAEARSSIGVLVFVAVLLHKIPEGLTVASVMRAGHKGSLAERRATWLLPASTLVGALFVTLFVSIDTRFIGFLFAFSAGSAVYVGAADLIPEINRRADHGGSFLRGRSAPILVFLGMLLFWIGAHFLNRVAGL